MNTSEKVDQPQNKSDQGLEQAVREDMDILQDWFGVRITPTDNAMTFQVD